MGTLDSKIWRPAEAHLPIGSSVTPRARSAWARSLRRVRSVFVRIVTGRGVSFASKNSIACFTRDKRSEIVRIE